MPLSLRRHKLQLQYAIKLQTSHNAPAESIVAYSWETHYGKFKVGAEPTGSLYICYGIFGTLEGALERHCWHMTHHRSTFPHKNRRGTYNQLISKIIVQRH